MTFVHPRNRVDSSFAMQSVPTFSAFIQGRKFGAPFLVALIPTLAEIMIPRSIDIPANEIHHFETVSWTGQRLVFETIDAAWRYFSLRLLDPNVRLNTILIHLKPGVLRDSCSIECECCGQGDIAYGQVDGPEGNVSVYKKSSDVVKRSPRL